MTFTTLPAFTYFPEKIVDGERTAPASVGSGRLVALLVTAATGSAHFAAVVNHRLILSPDPAKYPLSKSRLAYLTWLSSRSLNHQRWYGNAAEYNE